MGAKFGVRSAGVLIWNNKVLMQKRVGDENYALPGGGVEKNEFSSDALLRELMEECGESRVKIERLLFVCECNFSFNGETFQQIGFYHKLVPLEGCFLLDKESFSGIEEGKNIVYKWIDLDTIKESKIKPDFLKDRLCSLPNEVEHLCIED